MKALAGTRIQVSQQRLGRMVAAIAAQPASWRDIVRFDAGQRWYHRLDLTDEYEVWLLSWLPGQQTGFHDHGDAAGAFAIADGDLLESTAQVGRPAVRSRSLATGTVRSFGPDYVHDVRNASDRPAVSVHAYSPALSLMRQYEMTAAGLVLSGAESAEDGW
jgi:predicted metal-dependent enzyme (double-stranded beta helix superfamily)